MEIIRGKVLPQLNNTAITIGKFEGLHIGHRALIDKVIECKKQSMKSVVFTFPIDIKKGEYIYSNVDRRQILEVLGVDYLIEYPLDDETKSIDAELFVKDLLVDKLGIQTVFVGDDFKFGRARKGDADLLMDLSEKYNFQVEVLRKVKYDNEIVSTTRIKECILNGKIKSANAMLAHNYTIKGEVIYGKQLGRQIGIPTINIELEKGKITPPKGVYVSQITDNKENKKYCAITNIGENPTVENLKMQRSETHIIDYSGNLYGSIVSVELLEFIRPEKRFNSIEELVEQINADIECARG